MGIIIGTGIGIGPDMGMGMLIGMDMEGAAAFMRLSGRLKKAWRDEDDQQRGSNLLAAPPHCPSRFTRSRFGRDGRFEHDSECSVVCDDVHCNGVHDWSDRRGGVHKHDLAGYAQHARSDVCLRRPRELPALSASTCGIKRGLSRLLQVPAGRAIDASGAGTTGFSGSCAPREGVCWSASSVADSRRVRPMRRSTWRCSAEAAVSVDETLPSGLSVCCVRI